MPFVVLLLITGMLMTFVTWVERMREKFRAAEAEAKRLRDEKRAKAAPARRLEMQERRRMRARAKYQEKKAERSPK